MVGVHTSGGLCYAPDYGYYHMNRYSAGGADFFGPTCAQCEQDGRVFGGRRIWVPCDEKAEPCPPDEEQERELPSYCYPWGEAVERCGFLERFLETVLKVTRHATGSRMGTHHRGKTRKAASICGPAATRIRYDRLTTWDAMLMHPKTVIGHHPGRLADTIGTGLSISDRIPFAKPW